MGSGALCRGATLFGLADGMYHQIHNAISGPMGILANSALATVQATLGPAIFTEAFVTGQQMSLAETFATMGAAPVR